MFRILNLDGTEIGITEKLNYIRYHKNNQCYISASSETAEGISFESTAYQLYNRPELKEAKGIVTIETFDGGVELNNLILENKKLQNIIADTDEAIIQIYEMLEK